MDISTREKHALVEAASVFADHGVEIGMPWESDLDDRERELFDALLRACRAYDSEMRRYTG